MIQLHLNDGAVLCVIEPGNIRRLKEGKPWYVTLPNGFAWLDDQGRVHVDLTAFCQSLHMETTPENLACLEKMIYEVAAENNKKCSSVIDTHHRTTH